MVYSAPTQSATFTTPLFFRIHISTQNWLALIARINSAGPGNSDAALNCSPGSSCPANGYSSNVEDYRLQYAGVIAETTLLENGAPKNESTIRQCQMGAYIHGVGVYQYR